MEQFLSVLFGVAVTIVFGMVVVAFILETIHDKQNDDNNSEI